MTSQRAFLERLVSRAGTAGRAAPDAGGAPIGRVGRDGRVAPAGAADWDALYTRQLPRIYNFFRFRVGDGAEAEDLTSLTFEKAWSARDSYRSDLAAFSTWLQAIARNVAIDHLRRSRRRTFQPLDEAAAIPGGRSPEDLAVRRSDFERLEILLGRLEERERELLALRYGAEMSNRDIARMTGLTESNVGTILHRAIKALRADW